MIFYLKKNSSKNLKLKQSYFFHFNVYFSKKQNKLKFQKTIAIFTQLREIGEIKIDFLKRIVKSARITIIIKIAVIVIIPSRSGYKRKSRHLAIWHYRF